MTKLEVLKLMRSLLYGTWTQQGDPNDPGRESAPRLVNYDELMKEIEKEIEDAIFKEEISDSNREGR